MKRKFCKLCGQTIRRPVDHIDCQGAYDNWFLSDNVPPSPDREITRKIDIPPELANKSY